MLKLPALKAQQFTQGFYLLNLLASDVEHLVRLDAIGASGVHEYEGDTEERGDQESSPARGHHEIVGYPWGPA